jgi:hypothetical protein
LSEAEIEAAEVETDRIGPESSPEQGELLTAESNFELAVHLTEAEIEAAEVETDQSGPESPPELGELD